MRTIVRAMLMAVAGVVAQAGATPVVVCPAEAPPLLQLAAKEVARYIYLRTGALPKVITKPPARGVAIVLAVDPALSPEAYTLKTDGAVTRITGGQPIGVLYGAYRFAEALGVRFYLHGDVIPDKRLATLPEVNDSGKPLFATRGIQPFHDFPEGPDWWNQDDYLAYLHQLAKLRMNFIGLHCYPEGGVGPEPLVWIGLAADVGEQGQVQFSYPAQWARTGRNGMWGYGALKTADFAGGAGQLFPDDDYGADVLKGLMPLPNTPAQQNELFNRVGRQFHTVFAQARALGVKTCIGTETPLTIPAAVKEHLKKLGKNLDDPATVRELYDGMFKRIAAWYPVDYYWLWTPEGWTWGGNKPEEFAATQRDILAAYAALQALGKPFTIATSGWVLGPQHDRAALDKFLPKDCPMSCINRDVGHDAVEYAFANIQGRPKWAIPWMENDPNLVGYQPWVGRMRHDAVDARRLGCDGLLGIHWRTKMMAMNVAALAAAAWDQSWVPAAFDNRPVAPSRPGGAVGGQTAHTDAQVADTDAPEVYQSVRYDTDGYALPIANGTYTVTLKFSEITYHEAGKRVFGVKLQGQSVADKLDIFAQAGKNKAYDLVTPAVKVTDGVLKIEFGRIVEFPCIAGLVISGMTDAANQVAAQPLTRKINCGGGAVQDYEADATAGDRQNPAGKDRTMPVREFYVDFARAHFGPAVADEAGAILASLDGFGFRPNPSDWSNGPGNLPTLSALRKEAQAKGAVVERFGALRAKVAGAGNLQRFDYWLNTLRASVNLYEQGGIRGDLDALIKKLQAETDGAKKLALARDALALRLDLARKWDELMRLEISVADTPGELGTIANLEQHSRIQSAYLTEFDQAITNALGQPLPVAATPAMDYRGEPRVTVLTVRSAVAPGEALALRIIALDRQPAKSVTVRIRPLGRRAWQTMPAAHLNRAVYQAQLPAATDDFEYHVEAKFSDGRKLTWPATAPDLNQTVVVWAPPAIAGKN